MPCGILRDIHPAARRPLASSLPIHYLPPDSMQLSSMNTDDLQGRRRSPSRFFPVEAEQLLQVGEVNGAAELCKFGLVYFPENISGYAVLAQAYLMLGQPERALNVLEDGYRRTGAEGLRNFCDVIRREMRGEDADQAAPVSAERSRESGSQQEEPPSFESQEEETGKPEVVPGEVPEEVPEEHSDVIDSPSGEDVSAEIQEVALPDEAGSEKGEDSLEEEEVVREDRVGEDFAGKREFSIEVDVTLEPVGVEEEMETREEDPMEEEESFSYDFPFFIDLGSDPLRPDASDEEGVPSLFVSEPEDRREDAVEVEEPAETETEERRAEEEKGRDDDVSLRGNEQAKEEEEREEQTEEKVERAPETERVAEAEEGVESNPRKTDEPVELSIHSGTRISRLRSSNLRLIPGLEFAPLRRDEPKLKIAPLVTPPPPEPELPSAEPAEPESLIEEEALPSTPPPTMPEVPMIAAQAPTQGLGGVLPEKPLQSMTPLEELARRLETARIPIVEGEEPESESPAFEPSIVSDTFAGILAQQGAYRQAIKAYQMLARLKPERRGEYEKKIEEMRWKMTSVVREEEETGEEDPE